MKINLHKSVLYGIGVDDDEVVGLAEELGCKKGSLPFSYLGIKVGANMNRVSNWEPVVSKFKNRLSKWKANTLSIAGRLTLIKSVLDSLPTYYFSLFKAPKKVIGELEGLMRRFLWGGSDEVRKMSWVAWEIVTKRVTDGGLGVAPLEVNNNALIIKWLWRYLNEPNALWRRVVHSIHGSSRSWGIVPCNNALTGVWKNCATFWNKHKVEGRGINSIIRGKPGNGRNIRFWLDLWVGDGVLKDSFPNLYALEKCKRVKVCERLKVAGGVRLISWDWAHAPSSPEDTAAKLELENMLQVVGMDELVDKWVWSQGVDGGFEVAKAKRWLLGNPGNSSNFEFQWSSWVPNKCNIFMWRAFLDRLPTKMALVHRNMVIDNIFCPWCEAYEESIEHLITGCVVAHGVWDKISLWCRIPRAIVFHVKDVVLLHDQDRGSATRKAVLHGIVVITCWRLWKARNEKVFNGVDPNVVTLVADIKALGFLWYKNRFKGGVVDWERWRVFDVM